MQWHSSCDIIPISSCSTGLAERVVQTFKEGMKKLTDGSLETQLARFLFRYRLTPQSVTGVSPTELILGRLLRSQLDLLHPDIQSRVSTHQEQKKNHDCHARERQFQGDLVYVHKFCPGLVWLPRVVAKVSGPVSSSVKLEIGNTVRCPVNHLRECTSSADIDFLGTDDPLPFRTVADSDSATTDLQQSTTPSSTGRLGPQLTQLPVRHSRRHPRSPDRFGI